MELLLLLLLPVRACICICIYTTTQGNVVITTTTTTAAATTEFRKCAGGLDASLVFAPARILFVRDRLGDLRAELVDQRAFGMIGEKRGTAGRKRAGVKRWVEGAEDEPTGGALGGVRREGVCARLAKARGLSLRGRFGRWIFDVRDKLLESSDCQGWR